MVFKIDGVDITPYIAAQGLKWSRNDVESPNAGRTLDGIMHRGRVSTKIRWDITCRPLNKDELRLMLNLIYPAHVTVICDDPMYGRYEGTFYSNNNPAQFSHIAVDGMEWWQGITFPLVEV